MKFWKGILCIKNRNAFSFVVDWIQISRYFVTSFPLCFISIFYFHRTFFYISVFPFFCPYIFFAPSAITYYSFFCSLLFFPPLSLFSSALFSSFKFLLYFVLNIFHCVFLCYFSSFILFFLSAYLSFCLLPYGLWLCIFSQLPNINCLHKSNQIRGIAIFNNLSRQSESAPFLEPTNSVIAYLKSAVYRSSLLYAVYFATNL